MRTLDNLFLLHCLLLLLCELLRDILPIVLPLTTSGTCRGGVSHCSSNGRRERDAQL